MPRPGCPSHKTPKVPMIPKNIFMAAANTLHCTDLIPESGDLCLENSKCPEPYPVNVIQWKLRNEEAEPTAAVSEREFGTA